MSASNHATRHPLPGVVDAVVPVVHVGRQRGDQGGVVPLQAYVEDVGEAALDQLAHLLLGTLAVEGVEVAADEQLVGDDVRVGEDGVVRGLPAHGAILASRDASSPARSALPGRVT